MSDKPCDVFLSFNSEDRESVKKLACYLADTAGFEPWFDEWKLIPGEPWVRNLERGLAASSTCAVFVGLSGEGPWQRREVETALRHQVTNPNFRVIPVLLPDAPKQPELPMFLSGNMWVDFRAKGLDDDDTLWRLECGIRGTSPGRGRLRPTTTSPVSPPPPTSIAPNPFGIKGRITDQTHFYDREMLLQKIFEELHKGVSVSLVGESAVGKSSLLSMVCEKCPLPQTSAMFPNLLGVQCLYLSMQWIENEDEFYEAFCDELGFESCRGYRLTRALRDKRYVLCLDEIEKMAWKDFTVKVRSQLRGLADGPAAPLKLVIASRSPLKSLFPDSLEVDSPLAGICRQLDVGPFSPEIARDFLLHRLNETGIMFTDAQITSLIRTTAGHPAKLQEEAAVLYRELTK